MIEALTGYVENINKLFNPCNMLKKYFLLEVILSSEERLCGRVFNKFCHLQLYLPNLFRRDTY
jgi:hypothetical protein